MSPFTRSWLCLASFPVLLQSHWPAFPKLWAGVHPVPAATCSLLGILPPPTPGGFSASERRQGLASGKGVSSRPEWVFLGSRGKPQGCRCFNPFTSGVLSSHQSLCALVHRAYVHLTERKLPSGCGGATCGCSEGFLLSLKLVTCQNSLSETEGRRMLIWCG